MVAERGEVISASDHMSQMAHDLRWFTNKLGPDVVGESFFIQVNSPSSYAASKLEDIAFRRDVSGGNNFPALFNIAEIGALVLLRELGFVQNARNFLSMVVPHGNIIDEGDVPLEVVHIDKPFVAELKQLKLAKLRGLSNILSIRFDPNWHKTSMII